MILVKILKFLSSLVFFERGLHIMFDDVLDRKQFLTFKVREHNLQFLLGVLCIIGCPYSRWALIRGWALIRINTVFEKTDKPA